jgi:Tol biopolymer transport system component/DNA-binding SARP family transcriptional activator
LVPKIARPDHPAITELSLLRLNTFGRLFVQRDGQRLGGAAAQPRRLALLAVLAASGERGVTRDRLLAMLWPETGDERARKGLNQALYALRQELGADEVLLGAQDLRLNPELITSDVSLFSAALTADRLEQAAAEYTGPFLDGFHLSDAPEFERWLEEERAELARDYWGALERLARRAADGGNRVGAVEWWRKLCAQDPLNARVAIGLMEALVAAGDRASALKHVRIYEALVQEELDAPPDREVLALAERLRAQEEPAARPPMAVSAAPEAVLAKEGGQADGRTGGQPPGPAKHRARLPILWLVPAALVVGLGVGALSLARGRSSMLQLGRISRITAQPGLEVHPALSPDGKLLAFASGPSGQLRIQVRHLAGGRTISLTDGTLGDEHWPRWSPDGTRLSFETGDAVYVVPPLGGSAKPLLTRSEPDGPSFLAWSPDGGRLAYARGNTIEVVATEGDATTVIPTGDLPHSLSWSPDGSRLAFALGNAAFAYAANAIGNIAPSSIWVVPASGGQPQRVTDATSLNTSPVWMPDGRSLLFISDRDGSRDLYRVELSDGRLVRLTAGLSLHTIDLSRDGRTLTYAGFTEYANIWSLPIPTQGTADLSESRPVTAGHQSIEGIALSRDGQWLAFDSDRAGRQAIYRMQVAGGEPAPIVDSGGDDFMPAWSPDGREIAYYGFRDGRRRLFVSPVAGGAPVAVAPDSSNQRFPDWAPDGRQVVFHSDRTGRFELYIVARETDGGWGKPRQLTSDGGQEARWSPDGTAIVYVRGTGLWLIDPTGGAPRLLIDTGDQAAPHQPLLAQWGPDGHSVFYKVLDAEGRASIWTIAAGGGTPRLLVRFDDPVRPSPRAEFATDGKRLYFTVAERESDIWQMVLVGEGAARPTAP